MINHADTFPKYINYILVLLFFFSANCISAQFTRIVGARGLDDNTGGRINGHAWGDIDNDGDLDVIFFSATTGNDAQSKLFLNSGSPSYTFTDATSTKIAGFNDENDYARQMLIVDFNNDGYNDILRGFGSNREIEIFYNDGPPNYTFGLPTTQQPDITIGAPGDGNAWNTEGIVAVDWNQDGWLDLIVDNDNGGNDIWENNQAGGFTYIFPGTGVGQTGFPGSHSGDGDFMTAADIDNDGYVDLYGRKTAVTNYWWFNSTTSQFETQATPNIVSNESDKGGTMFCDFDNDGDLDLFWTSFGTNQIWRNDGGNVWTATGIPGNPVNTQSDIDGCDCGDYDNDGDMDIVLGAESGNSYLLENTTPDGGAMSFSTNNIAVNDDTESVTFVDFDNDGDLDIYFVVNGGANQLWENSTNNLNYLYVNALMDLGSGNTRPAIGANVFLTNCYGDTTTMRPVSGGKGHGSQHQTKLHFGVDPDLSYNVQVYYVYENGSRSIVTQSVIPSNETNQEITILDTDSNDAFYCADVDSDVIINLLDLDDDNDGIPDADERRICNTGTWVNIAGWYMNVGEGNTVTGVDSDVTAGDQTIGPGWDSWSIPFSSLNLNSTSMPQNLADAISGDFYVEYKILPGAGKAFDVKDISWGWNDFTNTPRYDFKVAIYSLTDNYTTPIIQDFSRPNDTDGYIWQSNAVDQPFLSDVIDSIVFRVYLYEPTDGIGGSAITSGFINWDDFNISGYHAPLDDCDGDGIPNIHDLDSDNDGILDGVEAGHGELLTNGVLTGTMGNNGLDNAVETTNDSGVLNYSITNTDSDGRSNPFDSDSDNDGCPDAVEAGHTDANNDGFLDGTGVDAIGLVTGAATSYTGNTPVMMDANDNSSCCDVSKSGFADFDGDNYADEICDLDDDNDGITDWNEYVCYASSGATATFTSSTESWQATGASMTAGNLYTVTPSGSSLGTRTVSGGPNNGLNVEDVRFASDRFADLDGYGYFYSGNSLESTLRAPLPIGFANLTGTEYDYLLTFVGLIDTDGNGQYDAGADQIIPRIFLETGSIRFTANVSGDFYIVFTDSNYSDNAGTFSYTVEECISVDSDGDGAFDYVDSDSDNDGCPDVVEAGHTDANADSILDGSGVDANGQVTGATTSYTGSTTDVINAYANLACCNAAQSGFEDNDGDNVADDLCDLDDDNDGILDEFEQMCGTIPSGGGAGTPTVVAGGTPITSIYTNFGDFWESSTGAISSTLPNTSHDLLAFTTGGVTYSTGVSDDDVLDTDGNGYYDQIDTDNDGTGNLAAFESRWQAFSNINDVTNRISMEGSLNDGDLSNALGLTLVDDPATEPLNPLLSNGAQGLDLGTGVANINETWYYSVEIIASFAVGDGVPDLIVTQVAQPSGVTSQTITLYDASWSPIGNAVIVQTSAGGGLELHLATYRLDLYNPNGSIFGANSTRPIRMASVELSEFGITGSNVGLVAGMSIEYSSGADAAFVAYNRSTFSGLCADMDTDGDLIPDRLDLDSDGDGCFDAIEAVGNFNSSNVNGSGELLGTVDSDGIPTITNGGQATTSAVIDDTDASQCACVIIRSNRHISREIFKN